jgi:hypothetical protein
MRINQPATLMLLWLASAATGQMVIDTKSGLVSFVEDGVYLNDRKLPPEQAVFPIMANHDVLRAENGRAEVILNPCVVLHLGDHSSLRMIENQTANARVELMNGSAVVHVDGKVRDSTVTLAILNHAIPLLKTGVFRFDVGSPPRVRVFSDSLTTPEAGGQIVVKAGSELAFVAHPKPVAFDRRNLDVLDIWSRARETILAKSSDQFQRERQREREVQEAGRRAASVEIDTTDQTAPYHRPRQAAPPLFSAQGPDGKDAPQRARICGE